ncbi:MAG: hypothetical protein HC767_01220 [Akkermansiaceae bacterium]|nr:hypothetical protein [Akkermansiaceae bacterium]
MTIGESEASDSLWLLLISCFLSQVMLDTKAVMRSMRLGSEDFDTNYNTVVLRGQSWKDVLGGKLIPDVIVASRQHVLRSDFAPYDFHSAASLLRFTANTIGHFEELQLGLQLSKVAFLDAILALFPALVPVCYHYLAAYPSLHVRNRDSELVRHLLLHQLVCSMQ